MNEDLERPAPPPTNSSTEAGILQESDIVGGVNEYPQAEILLAREEFQRKIERKTRVRDHLRPRWKRWLGIDKADPKKIEIDQALEDDERIHSLIASGKAKNVADAIEYLNRVEASLVSSPKELDLEQRELSRTGDLLGGVIGGATFVQLKDDGSAVYKPHDAYEGKRRMEFIHNERAAYLIDRFLGFNFVPPTVVRELTKGIGSLQEFIADAKLGYELKPGDLSEEERLKIELFDALIVNSDRNLGNYLVKDGKIYAIDHGLALSSWNLDSTYGMRQLVEKSKIPVGLLTGLKRFSEWQEGQELLQDALTELYDENHAGAIMKRIRLFLAAIDRQGNFCREKFCKGFRKQTFA